MLRRTKELNTDQNDTEIGIPSNECCKHDPEKKVVTLKIVIETNQLNLYDPKLYLKNSLDTLRMVWQLSFRTCFS